jgi:tRNA modification GTPase
MMQTDTIVALASGHGRAGVAVMRVSGPHTVQLMQAMCGFVPPPRLAKLAKLKDANGLLLDRALVLMFPAPNSFTGETVGEFHLHGGAAVIEAVLGACLQTDGVRLAAPGEFTRRAFENGKMDLSEAEGLGDLIDAETEAQRRQALRQMEGHLRLEVEGWRESLLDALASAEGDIDFPDEDLPPGLSRVAVHQIESLRDRLTLHVQASAAALRVRDGFRVAIIGPPNAGKSSLLNNLAGRDAAMVSDIAGTTRDIVEVRLVLNGAVVWISDTAGLRETSDVLEEEGVRRALAQAERSDMTLALYSTSEDIVPLAPLVSEGDLWVQTKIDFSRALIAAPGKSIAISNITGAGLSELEQYIADMAAHDLEASESGALTRVRHRAAVQEALACLDRALDPDRFAVELVAEDLRLAMRSLERICGRVDMEDILDRIFSRFCIGK